MDLNLRDKVAVVTGGSVGIGLAIAQGLAREGVHLVLCARQEERVKAIAQSIQNQNGVRAIGIRADLSREQDIHHFVHEVQKEFQGIDILINKAAKKRLWKPRMKSGNTIGTCM